LARPALGGSTKRHPGAAICADRRAIDRRAVRVAIAAADDGAGRAAAARATAGRNTGRMAVPDRAAVHGGGRTAATHVRTIVRVANAGPAAVDDTGRAPARGSGTEPGAVCGSGVLACPSERRACVPRAPGDHARV